MEARNLIIECVADICEFIHKKEDCKIRRCTVIKWNLLLKRLRTYFVSCYRRKI